jgi:5-methylcytosine-specific restriction endonuclease McrA
MGMKDLSKHPPWFREWQLKHYNSKEWIKKRNDYRESQRMRCEKCKTFITGKSIVDHIIELTTDNYLDDWIMYHDDNLQLLCLSCHNTKTFSPPMETTTHNRKDVNLF